MRLLSSFLILQENRFTKCDTCVKINLELEKSSKSTKEALNNMKKKHLSMVE